MKTRAKSVIVELLINDRIRFYTFPIVTENGDLMTHRLERLLDGKVSSGDEEKSHIIHYVGISWHAPYLILEDLNNECNGLLRQIEQLGVYLNPNELLKPAAIPSTYHNEKITFLVRRQLMLRRKLKQILRRAHQTRTI